MLKRFILASKKKMIKGFTLIELLSVIAIFSIIALITIPIVTNLIETSRRNAFKSSVIHGAISIESELAANDFEEFPDKGIPANDPKTGLENNPFISGFYKRIEREDFDDGENIYAWQVTDGRYCANGYKTDLEIVLGECQLLDETAPVLNLLAGTITTRSIQVIANAIDEESEIISYEFSKDNGKTWTDKQKENNYTFDMLTKNTSFTIKVKVTNANNLVTEKSITLKTNNIDVPTYTSNPSLATWSKSKVITIHYPERQTHFIYEYTKDGGKNWNVVASGTTYDITFNSNGTLIARVRDGYNTVIASTLTITTIDNTPPTCTTSGGSSNWTNGNITLTGICNDVGGSGCVSNITKTYSNNVDGNYSPGSVKDIAGNVTTCPTSTVKIDKTKPTCGTITLNGTMGNNGWYRSVVTIGKSNGSDALSGHASTKVTHSSVGDTSGTTITLTTTDNAGNTCITTKQVKVDTKPPQNITVYVKSSSSYSNQTNITLNVPATSPYCTSGSQYGLSTYNANDGGSPVSFYYNYSSTLRCPNGTAFTGCRAGENYTRRTFSPTSIIPDLFAGTAGYHDGYYTGYSTGVYTIWAEDAAGNTSNQAKITMNFCTR